MEFIRAEDYYVLQTGDPEGPEEGFIDPKTGKYRAIPLEILVKGDEAPIYGATLESLGRFLDEPGTALFCLRHPGHGPSEYRSQWRALSQFFFLSV